jgi:phosphoenolpyruvate synthase/pyruvate phosphate dikinase
VLTQLLARVGMGGVLGDEPRLGALAAPEDLSAAVIDLEGGVAGDHARPRSGDPELAVAVRSSATAKDTAETSFAGMNETFLNIRGAEAVLDAVRRCWRSLFGARIAMPRYRRICGLAPPAR